MCGNFVFRARVTLTTVSKFDRIVHGDLLREGSHTLGSKTDIAFMVSFKVHRINDGSSPKVISEPTSQYSLLSFGIGRRVRVLDA